MDSKKYVIISIIVILIIFGGVFWFIHSQNKKVVEEIGIEYNNGSLDDAIAKGQSQLDKSPNNVEVLLALAATYAEKGSVTFKEEENAKKAIEYADRALSSSPSKSQESEAYRIKGYSYEIQEMYKEAHENYEKAMEIDPKNSQAFSNNGHAYDLEGDMVKAEDLYIKAINITPSNDHALLNLGRLYIRQEKIDEARTTLDNLLSSSPNKRMKGEAYQLLSYLSYLEEDFDGAMEAINQSVSLDPNMSVAWVTKAKIELGTALDMSNELELQALIDLVESDIDKALAINPNQASAYLLLSEIEIITGNKAKENELRNKALQAIPLDITLGKAEKEAMKAYLESTIKITKSSAEGN